VTSATARTIANVLVLSAGAAAAYVILTTPPLRRFALRASRAWLGASLPLFLANEVRKAWAESARGAASPSAMGAG
jgi:hypothetical protein